MPHIGISMVYEAEVRTYPTVKCFRIGWRKRLRLGLDSERGEGAQNWRIAGGMENIGGKSLNYEKDAGQKRQR